ncbi:hypothetical protein LCGC14_1324040 [marine sediment metagenome]|uniref:Uncharacterized protein n=1 Tax=marine sediment metagenome TaxID=412755 RepID=A0A0F9MZH1_9ZZZZ
MDDITTGIKCHEEEISREEFDAHLLFIDKLEAAFQRYAAEVGIKNANQYSYDGCDSTSVEFEWWETWSYSGNETHCERMPIAFLFDYKAWKIQHEVEREVRAKAEAEHKERQETKLEQAERAMLKKLQERYGV